MKKENHNQAGYTIIETMIAISVFLVVIMAGMGALLNANLLHQKSRDMRSIMDNLNFIMEDMSRNLRTGYNYECFYGIIPDADAVPYPASCPNGEGGIFFISTSAGVEGSVATSKWMYYIGQRPDDSAKHTIFKRIEGGVPLPLTPAEVNISPLSGFVVTGATAGDDLQPLVTIRLMGEIQYKDVVTPFSLQTTVSQRNPDIL